MESWPARVVGAPALAGAPVVIVGEGRRRHTFVAEDDVAAFAVAAVDSPQAINQRVAIGGPEALSWRDVVALYERVVGRPLEVRFVSAGEPVPGLPPAVLPLLASFDTYDSVFDTQQPASLFGITLTSLETIARRQAAA
jgi:NADH dehydrogenase